MLIILRILGVAVGAFMALVGIVGISEGESVGFFTVFTAAAIGLIFLCLRHSPVAKRILGWSLLVGGLFIAFGAFSGSTSQKHEVVSEKGSSVLVGSGKIAEGTVARKLGDDSFGPGDTVDCNGVQITFLGVDETPGTEFLSADYGKIFALAEFEIANNTSQQINISSIFGSSAYCDDYLVQESLYAGAADPKGRDGLTGSIAPGKKLRGIIGYELPSQWQVLEIRIQTDWWKGSYSDEVTFVARPA